MRVSARIVGLALAALIAGGCSTAATTSTSHAPPTTTSTSQPAVHQADMTAEQITAAMQREGLKTGAVIAYTATTDPNDLLGRQGGYTSKTAWSQPGDATNSVEVYPDAVGAAQRYVLLESLTGGLIGDGWVYVQGNAILRLSKANTPHQMGLAYSDFLTALGV
jgi:hypothetical protein